MSDTCPECGAEFTVTQASCEEYFHQFLYWEQADMERLGVVHHLMVLGYYLQHPSRYSPQGLDFAKGLLVDFVERGISPRQIRQRESANLDSGKRAFKIAASPGSHGAYQHPVPWTMRASDVLAGGAENYVVNVQAWARSIHAALLESGELV